MTWAVSAAKLTKRYGKAKACAVDGLTFHVAYGEIYGLLGPNGAGKTTTLKMLATLLQPTSGELSISGVDATKTPREARQKLAYIPAEAGLPPRLSGRETVLWFARIQGVSRAAYRTDELLERLGATSFADEPTANLSTGMKRRIVIARALVHDPKVLLLDEPTDGLDVPGRRDVLTLLTDLANEQRAIVLSSHLMSEVDKVVSRAGVVNQGRLAAEGTLDELRAQTNATNLDDAFLAIIGQ